MSRKNPSLRYRWWKATLSLFALITALAPMLIATGSRADAPVYDYKVTAKKPQDRANYVQGLQILHGHLYVSTGINGASKLLRYRFSDGELLASRPVDSRLFAEGLTVLEDRIYQLTWKSGLVLVYDKDTLAGIEYFRIPGQGWGLTHNGEQLIYSDGSHRLHYLSPEAKAVIRTIEVTENGLPLSKLNELEWIDGQVWANVWMSDHIVIIDPESGEVTASVDLQGILPLEERRQGINNVLNGIATAASPDQIVTALGQLRRARGEMSAVADVEAIDTDRVAELIDDLDAGVIELSGRAVDVLSQPAAFATLESRIESANAAVSDADTSASPPALARKWWVAFPMPSGR